MADIIKVGGKKIKNLPIVTRLNNDDDLIVENSVPKTNRVKWETIKSNLREDLSDSFSDIVVKETVHGTLMSNWFIIPDKENYSLAAVYSRRDDAANYVQGIQRRSTGGYTVLVNGGTNGAEMDFLAVWVKNGGLGSGDSGGSGEGEGSGSGTDGPVTVSGDFHLATKTVNLSYASSTLLRGYALFDSEVISATATIEDQKNTPVLQTDNVYTDVGYGQTGNRVEVYAKGANYVNGHLLKVHVFAAIKGKVEDPPSTGSGDCNCPENIIISDTLETLTGAYNATEHGLNVENTGLQNSDALQALIDTLNENGGGTIYIPAGEYMFAQTGDVAQWGGTSVRLKNNVSIVGDGASTVLLPTGTEEKCFNMFGGANTDWTYLENCRFENFAIDGKDQHCQTYSTSGKGFALNLVKNCHWRNIIVRNTDATGFGMDCPINCSIVDCVAENCGKAATTESPGASGFGIGFGRTTEESMFIHNCTAIGNKRFGVFFEHQGRFWAGTDYYPATYSRGFFVSDCISQMNNWNYGCIQGIGVTYRGCSSAGAEKFGYYLENSQQCNILNCVSASEGDTAYVIKAGIDPADNTARPNKDNKIVGCISKLNPYACKIVSTEPKCEMTRNIIKDCYFNLAQTNTILMMGEMKNLILQGNVSNGAPNISSAEIEDFVDYGNSWNTDTFLKIISYTPEKTSPQEDGTSVAFGVQAQGGAGALQYRFYRTNLSNMTTTVFRDWGVSNRAYCNPGTGKYLIYAEVRDEVGSIVSAQTLYEWTAKATE